MSNRDLWIRIGARVDGFMAGINKAQAGVKGFTAELEKSAEKRQAFDDLGMKMGLVGTAALAASAVAVKSFADFDQAMSHVAATGDDARGSIDALRQAALDAGAQTAFSATESAAAIEDLAKAGVSAADILDGGLSGALDLAAAGTIGVSEAAEIAATTMNQFGLAGQDMGHIADVLAAASGKAMGEVTDMAQAFKYVGPIASQMGISLEETGGSIAYLAQQGVLGDQAGTSLRGMISSLTSPSKIAASTMKQLGINVYDANGQFVGFRGVAEQLKTTMGGLSNAERDAALGRIFGNEQITTARLLYKGGAAEIDRWTRAVDDSGYAAETAATKMDNLKGDWEEFTGALETALIGTGEGADGPLRGMLQTLTELVNAYNALPGPVKSAIGLLSGVGGVALIGAAGLMKLATSVAETRIAMQTLGISAAGTKGAMVAVAKGAGVAAAAIGGVAIAFDQLDRDSAASVEDITAAILDLSDGAKTLDFNLSNSRGLASMVGGVDEFSATIREAHKGTEGFNATMGKVFGGLGNLASFGMAGDALNPYKDAIEDVEALDSALSQMVSSGATDQAARGFEEFSAAAKSVGLSTSEIEELLPGYTAALTDVDNQSRVAAAGTNELAGATAEMSAEQQAAQDAARKTAASFMEFGDSLDDSKVSLSDWISEMAQQASALRNFTRNAQNAARKGLDEGLIASLEAAGPAGARRMAQLANASDRELKRANRAWRNGEKAIDEYVRATGKVPRNKSTRVTADTGEARGSIRAIESALNNLPSVKTIHIRAVSTAKKAIDDVVGAFNADGSVMDFYANGGMSESHVAQIAPAGAWRVWAEPETGGEAYIPLHPSKRARSIDIWAETGRRLGMQNFADGGVAPSSVTASLPSSAAREIGSEVRRALEGARFIQDSRGLRLALGG